MQQDPHQDTRRGSALALIAVSLTALLAATSLAIDMGQFMTARGEAQRIADAAALAGASVFMDIKFADNQTMAEDSATFRAKDYAARNAVRGVSVDSANDVVVQVMFPEEKVRVYVRRVGMGTWFARFAQIFSVDISAMAAAQAVPSNGVTCLKPWAIPDLWLELNGQAGTGGKPKPNTDADGDGYWDENEGVWQLNDDPVVTGPPSSVDERYKVYDPDNPNDLAGTGYLTLHRGPNRDRGALLVIKPQQPGGSGGPQSISSPFFFAWDIDPSDQVTPAEGASQYRADIRDCSVHTVYKDTTYYIEPGNMVGPTRDATNDLIAEDGNSTYWDDQLGELVSTKYTNNPEASPRVVTVAVFDPSLIPGLIGAGGPGDATIRFELFVKIFIESGSGGQGKYVGLEPIKARFLGIAAGTERDEDAVASVKQLILVE